MYCFLVLLNICNMNILIDCNIIKLFWNIKMFRYFLLLWLYDRKFNMIEMFD